MNASMLHATTFSLVAAACLALHLPALAAASAQANVEGGPGQQVLNVVGNDPTLLVAETSAVSGGSSATSYANQVTGELKDFAQATNAFYGTPYAASASSGFTDSVVFSGGVGQTAWLDWSFDGSLALLPTNLPYATFGQLLVIINGGFANIMLSAFAGNCGGGTIFADCTVGTSVDKQGSIPFVIQAGEMSFGANLQAYAQYGNSAAFSNTGRIFIRTPEGVTYSSLSGQFLEQAAPIFTTAVPEPETYALLAAGLAVVGVMSRRRRSRA